MKRKVGFLLALAMIVTTVPIATFAQWESPLKKYNLLDDVTGGNNLNDGSRERVMDTFYENSLGASKKKNSTTTTSAASLSPEKLPVYEIEESVTTAEPRRNDILRDSSRNVYADTTTPAGWEVGPSFYPNPSFNSIVAKYKKSDFAGCLQECTSYVRKNPNDTLGFYYLAMCYTKVNDKDNAVRAYEKVISLNANPMIVKYATNGRNCVLGNDNEKCYQNVNEPEYIYPYKDIAKSIDLTPVDPNTLINRNLTQLKTQLAQEQEDKNKEDNAKDANNSDKAKAEISLPFGKQDADLDKFINAPYGNGLSPDLNKEYKQTQLKRFQESINQENDENLDNNKYQNIKDIKNFDKYKTNSEQIKLAYEIPDNVLKDIENNPEYIQQKKELDELNMLLGNDKSSKGNDITDLIPYMNESNSKNLSPEVIQTLMMQSMMGGFEI
jgi:hypothetical protein